MLQSEVYDNNGNLSESQIYDDLSQIIKSFKYILISMENICASLYRYEPINSGMQELKDTMKGLYSFVKMYSTPIDNHSEHKNTFHRFICRLIESISTYKVKFQNLPYFSILAGDINVIEQAVISYQQEKNIGSVIKKLQTAINRFCNKIIKRSESYTKNNENQDDPQVGQQKESEFPAISRDYHQQQSKAMELAISTQIKPKKVVESKSQNSLNRVMNLLNRRFKTISCMDIEYQQFKQVFFRSRDAKQQLFDDCLQRNSLIYKQMLRYSRQFSQYLQRRQLKIFRKNKFVDSLMASGGSNRMRRMNNSSHEQETSYNFTKKRVSNYSQHYQNEVTRKTVYMNQFNHRNDNNNNQYLQMNTPLLSRSEFIDGGRSSNLRSIQHQESYGSLTPQLAATPQLIEKSKKLPLSREVDYEQRFQDMSTETFLELTKRKKNLQLKKIDISLTSFNTSGDVQSAKTKTKLLNAQVFKKTPIQTSKQIQQKVNTSIRKNYLHKKYQQAMKKNLNQHQLEEICEPQKIQQQKNPAKYSSVKCIDPERQESPTQIGKERKYLFKTSNKRNINTGTQFKSLNHPQRKQFSTIKNFRKLKMEQGQKIERLQKMKEMALNHMQLCSGGRSIRPAFIYRQREPTQNPSLEITQQDFSENNNIMSYKQVQQQ